MTTASAHSGKPARVVLIDDHAMIRQGIRSRLDQEDDILVVGEAESREAGISLVEQLHPDVVVLDIRLGQDSGIEVAKALRARHPEVKILILSAYDFDQYVRALARVGVDGYISKGNSQEELVDAIREVISGGAVLIPRVASKVMRNAPAQPSALAQEKEQPFADDLTLREIEVLQLMRDGLKNQGIAEHLAIDTTKVESLISLIMAKLGATSRAEAIKSADSAGLL